MLKRTQAALLGGFVVFGNSKAFNGVSGTGDVVDPRS
jgi:hypothetical protein